MPEQVKVEYDDGTADFISVPTEEEIAQSHANRAECDRLWSQMMSIFGSPRKGKP